MKYWLHQAATAGDSLEQFGLACLEVHSQIAESSQNTLLRAVVGVVELLLALALTRNTETVSAYCEATIAELPSPNWKRSSWPLKPGASKTRKCIWRHARSWTESAFWTGFRHSSSVASQ
jgi:hypothetical protein